MQTLQTRTLTDKEDARYKDWQPWFEAGNFETGTQVKGDTSPREPVVYVIPGLTNSASPIGQIIVRDYFRKDADEVTAKEGSRLQVCEISSAEERENEFDKLNNQRISLLARKYENTRFSREDSARLEILKARVRRMRPSVTVDDYEALAKISDEVNDILRDDQELRNKLNLK